LDIKNLLLENVERIKQECDVLIRKARALKINITRAEEDSLKNIKRNPDIKILKADKGMLLYQ
jgi:hypothetical protein